MFFRFKAHTTSTIGSFVSRLTNTKLSDWLSLILEEFKIKSKSCLFLLVFNLSFTALSLESKFFGTLSSSSCYCSNFAILEVYFVHDKLNTEIKQTIPYYVNLFMTKGVMIDINRKPLVELKISLLLWRGVLFCVSSDFCFRYFTTSSFRSSRKSPLNWFTKNSPRN